MKYLHIYNKQDGKHVATLMAEPLLVEQCPALSDTIVSEYLDILVPSQIHWVLSLISRPNQPEEILNRIAHAKSYKERKNALE